MRTLDSADREALEDLFARVSETSLRCYFLGSVKPRARHSAWLGDVDGYHRIALGAFSARDDSLVGLAHCARDIDDPSRAECGVLVDDAIQRRGVGTRLLEELVRLARGAGIVTLRGETFADNVAAQALASRVGNTRFDLADYGIVGIELRIATPAPQLRLGTLAA